MHISIEGALVCGETVKGSYEYAGGKEGYSQIGWYIHQVKLSSNSRFPRRLTIRISTDVAPWLPLCLEIYSKVWEKRVGRVES